MLWKFNRSFFNMNLGQSNHIKAKLNHKKLSLLELEPRITPVITAVADNILVANNIETILYVLNNDTDTNGTGLQLSNLGTSYTAGDPNPIQLFPTITPAGPTLIQNPDNTFTFKSTSNGTFTFEYSISSKEVKVQAQNSEASDRFGSSIALSSDGNTMAVGAPLDNVGSNSDQGSVYLFSKSGNNWILQSQIFASDGAGADSFGSSVSISGNGNTLIVGTPGSFQTQIQGSVYVFTRSSGVWTEQPKILVTPNINNPSSIIGFGSKVIISADGNTLFASAQSGGQYIYSLSSGVWTQQADLAQQSGTNYFYHQGNYAALSADGNAALLGYESFPVNGVASGTAFFYSRTNGVWTLQSQVTHPNLDANTNFGYSVGLSADGNTAIISAPSSNSGKGNAFIYTRSASTWSLQTTLNPQGNLLSSQFGGVVGISNDGTTVFVKEMNVFTPDSGIFFFQRSNNIWTHTQSLYGYSSWSNFSGPFLLSPDGNTLLSSDPQSNSVFSQAWQQSKTPVTLTVGTFNTPNISTVVTDTGFSNSDGITNDQTIFLSGNASPNNTVTLYNGANNIGSTLANSQGSWLFDHTATTLLDGLYSFTATSTDNNSITSPRSQILNVIIDTVSPTGTFALVDTPRTTPVATINLNFSEPIAGFDIKDLTLTRDGKSVFLTGARITNSGNVYTITGIQGITSVSGNYTFTLNPNGTSITDIAGNLIQQASTSVSWFTDATPVITNHIIQAASDTYKNIAPNTNVVLNVLQNDLNLDGGGLQLSNLGTSYTAGAPNPVQLFPIISPAGPTLIQNPDNTFTFNSPTKGVFSFEYSAVGKEVKVQAQNSEAYDQFGSSIALSSDGNTMAVSAPLDNVGSNSDQGSVYLFSKSGNNWILQSQIFASDGIANDSFGSSVSVSGDGNTLVVGAPGSFNTYIQGGVYVFTRSSNVWTEQPKILVTPNINNPSSIVRFGSKVIISADGSTLFAGTQYGVQYIYSLSGGVWTQEADLAQQSGMSYLYHQGNYAALSADGNTALLSYESFPVNGVATGSAFFYSRTNGVWTLQSQVTPPNLDAGSNFGSSVGLSADGNTAIIGSSVSNSGKGIAFIYTRSASTWSLQTTLNPKGNLLSSNFGGVVGISNDGTTVFVKEMNVFTADSGIFFFQRSNNIWTYTQSLYGYSSWSNFSGTFLLSPDGNTLLSSDPQSNSVFSQAWQQSKTLVTIQVGESDSHSLSGGSTAFFFDITNDGVADLLKTDLGSIVITNQANGQIISSFNPYPQFQGAIHVGAGDFEGNGQYFIVTAPGVGGGPHVMVIDPLTGAVKSSFFAYNTNFRGGVVVAVGDINGDGIVDIVTGAGPGGGPNVRVFDGRNNQLILDFMAYAPTFIGGVSIALGDVNGDGRLDIITGAGAGGAPHVKAFDAISGNELLSFMAYDSTFLGGVFVAAGDIHANGTTQIVTGTGFGGAAHVKIFESRTLAELNSFYAYDAAFIGGVRVGLTDRNNDGIMDIITGAGPTGGPHVKIFDGNNFELIDSFFLVDPSDIAGVFMS
ncbi:MAG: Ig-like domain-containing protein [Planctomycetota bacterium]|nr:Ig-like domain-containing protein [Planctomycetota bacterium]